MGFKRAYLCDGCGCEARCGLTNARCRHTTDESHAIIKGEHKFERHGDLYFELDPQENKNKEEVS